MSEHIIVVDITNKYREEYPDKCWIYPKLVKLTNFCADFIQVISNREMEVKVVNNKDLVVAIVLDEATLYPYIKFCPFCGGKIVFKINNTQTFVLKKIKKLIEKEEWVEVKK